MTNQFDSKGGGQNIGQGDHAIGKQVNATQPVSGHGNIFSGTGNVTVNGIPPALFAEYAGKLAVTDSALASFFRILEEQQVPPGDLDAKLREIATGYKELLARVGGNQAAKQAIEAGDYAKAEKLLDDVANQHSLAAAKAHADNARLQEVQLRYAKAATYWQKAAALLPEDKKQERSRYLNNAGYDLYRIAKYKEALPLYEQSLAIWQEIGDRAGEGATLSNIGALHHAKGEYGMALKYQKQSLVIHREVGNRAKEGATLNNIGQIYNARGDYGTALKYLRQSLVISQEIGDRAGEGTTLNNIGMIYKAWGDYGTALKYLEQSLAIVQETGNRAEEAVMSWNIGLAYYEQGDLAKAEQYISRAMQLAEEIGHPSREKYRTALADIRAKLRSK